MGWWRRMLVEGTELARVQDCFDPSKQGCSKEGTSFPAWKILDFWYPVKYFPPCKVNPVKWHCSLSVRWDRSVKMQGVKPRASQDFTSSFRIVGWLRLEETAASHLVLQDLPAQAGPPRTGGPWPCPVGFCSHRVWTGALLLQGCPLWCGADTPGWQQWTNCFCKPHNGFGIGWETGLLAIKQCQVTDTLLQGPQLGYFMFSWL